MNNYAMDIEETLNELSDLITQLPHENQPFHSQSSIFPSSNPLNLKNQVDQILDLQESALQVINETLTNMNSTKIGEFAQKTHKHKKTKKEPLKDFTNKINEFYQKSQAKPLPILPNTEPKKNLRSNEKPTQKHLNYQTISSNKPQKSKIFPLESATFSTPPLPSWLKEMHSVDFRLLGDIVLLNNENFSEDDAKKLKKDPSYH